MGKIKEPLLSKLFVGMISNSQNLFILVQNKLKKRFGPIDFESKILPFDTTDYYQKEMGENLVRKFISFEKLIMREKIAKIKNITNKIETFFSIKNKRQINLDPGYLTLHSVILVTTKDYQHRIYLQNGIYAEVTLCYKNGTYIPNLWTYPDYRKNEYLEIFNTIRNIYNSTIRRINNK